MSDKTPQNVNPYIEVTRFIPHPDGRLIHITMPPFHWRALDWLYESEGITAGFILHAADHHKNAPPDMNQAFIEFIEGSIQDQKDIRQERYNARKSE